MCLICIMYVGNKISGLGFFFNTSKAPLSAPGILESVMLASFSKLHEQTTPGEIHVAILSSRPEPLSWILQALVNEP